MNIVPVYPNIVPLAQQPATESARRDNIRRERIPAPTEGEAGATSNNLKNGESESTLSYSGFSMVSAQNAKKEDTYSLSSLRQSSNPDKLSSPEGTDTLTADAIQAKDETDQNASNDDDSSSDSNSSENSKEEKAVKDLEERDQEVRTHEQAHKAAGGQYAGSPAFDMTLGPDGKSYATGGHVDIDVSAIPNDPQATIRKMEQIKQAALAPAEPSTQDVKVAARANMIASAARSELVKQSAQKPMEMSSETDQTEVVSEDTNNTESQSVNKENPFISQQMRQRGLVILNRYLASSSTDRQQAQAVLNRYI